MKRVFEADIESDFEQQYCWDDDQRYLYNPLRRKASVFGYFLRIGEVIRLVQSYSPGKRVADLACGQGNFGLMLAERGFDVTAVDIQPEFLRYAKKKYSLGKYQTVVGNLMDFRDKDRFDCVLVGEVIEHIAFPKQLLTSVRENLLPGGICVLTTPNGADYSSTLPTYSQVEDVTALIPRQFHWGDHLFLYTESELRELFTEGGMEVIYFEKYNSAYVSQLKAIRYLLPLRVLRWMERKTRHWTKEGKDSANLVIAVARKIA